MKFFLCSFSFQKLCHSFCANLWDTAFVLLPFNRSGPICSLLFAFVPSHRIMTYSRILESFHFYRTRVPIKNKINKNACRGYALQKWSPKKS